MIKVNYDAEHNAVIVEFEGNVDAAQARQYYADLEKALPKGTEPLKLLVDISSINTMELEARDEIEKGMDLLNAHGLTDIFRASPSPNLDIGFSIMATAHFHKRVRIHTLRSREEAQTSLYGSR
jgi:hypothetical protein